MTDLGLETTFPGFYKPVLWLQKKLVETVAGSPSRKSKCPPFFAWEVYGIFPFCLAGNPSVQVNPDGCSGNFSSLSSLYSSLNVHWFGTFPSSPQSHRKGRRENPEKSWGHSSSFLLEKNSVPFPKLPKGKGDYKAISYMAHWANIYPWLCLSFGNRNKCNELQKQTIHVDY